MKPNLSFLAAAFAAFALAFSSWANEVEWTPEANMDHKHFPSLLIATATARPVEEGDAEGNTPDPYLLGEWFGRDRSCECSLTFSPSLPPWPRLSS